MGVLNNDFRIVGFMHMYMCTPLPLMNDHCDCGPWSLRSHAGQRSVVEEQEVALVARTIEDLRDSWVELTEETAM